MTRTAAHTPSPETLERERRALELRGQNRWTYQQIADELGYAHKGNAYKAVKRALGRTLQEPADVVRQHEAEMLDALHRDWWEKRHTMAGADVILKTSTRRGKLLGLDAPVRSELTVSVDERTAALVVSVLSAILSDLKLTPEQEVIAGEVVPRHLQALDAPQAS